MKLKTKVTIVGILMLTVVIILAWGSRKVCQNECLKAGLYDTVEKCVFFCAWRH